MAAGHGARYAGGAPAPPVAAQPDGGRGAEPVRAPRRSRRRALAGLLLALLVVLAACSLSSFAEVLLGRSGAWVAAHPLAGAAAYAALFVLLFVLLVPTTPMELFAGYAFGFYWGLALLLVLQPAAHAAAFLLGRRLGLLRVGRALRGHVRLFEAVEVAIREDPVAAWQTIFLVCIAYLPAGPKVYGLASVSSVRLPVLLACAAVGCAPHALVNAWLGSSVKDLQALAGDSEEGLPPEARRARLCLLLLNAVALLACMGAVAWYGKRALDKLPRQGRGADGGLGAPLVPTRAPC